MTRVTAPLGAAGSMPHPALPFNTVFNYPGFVPDARERRAGVQRDDRSHADHIRAARSDGQLCPEEIGRASCRERVYIVVADDSLEETNTMQEQGQHNVSLLQDM